ncbi:hypothetical protein chiPu_0025964 [Chiloscyllium punctatum]|uniref:Uncharacterized protein n=1 Tax=Chiloscyllium punctatum TaxID=137246 RepID=A0A401TGH7_CHIPU|nr:hypothetical protein [Chiloscyllium punctatum]
MCLKLLPTDPQSLWYSWLIAPPLSSAVSDRPPSIIPALLPATAAVTPGNRPGPAPAAANDVTAHPLTQDDWTPNMRAATGRPGAGTGHAYCCQTGSGSHSMLVCRIPPGTSPRPY